MKLYVLKNFLGKEIYGIYSSEEKAVKSFKILKPCINKNIKLAIITCELDSDDLIENFI